MLDGFHEMGPEGDGRWPKEALIYYSTISYYSNYTRIIVYTILLHYIILYYTTTLSISYYIILLHYVYIRFKMTATLRTTIPTPAPSVVADAVALIALVAGSPAHHAMH